MVAPLDIFKTDEHGNVFWCGQAESLDDAKARVQTLARTEKADYAIFSAWTGHTIVFDRERFS